MSQSQPDEQLVLFHFDAFDAARGLTVEGSWWATSHEQAMFWLKSHGYTEIRLRPRDTTVEQVRCKDAALAVFYRQLAVMFSAGIPLSEALRLASFSEDRNLSGTGLRLAELLGNGYSLSRAMRTFPSTFDSVTSGLIAAAESSGRLSHILVRIADRQESRHKLKTSLISALTYPAILVFATLLMALLFFIYIFPIQQDILISLRVEQPAVNRMLSSLLAMAGSPAFAAFLLAVGGWAWLQSRSPLLRPRLRRGLLQALTLLPAGEQLVTKARAMRKLEILALMLDGGASVDLALKFMIEAAGDEQEEQLVREVRELVIGGDGFAQAVRRAELFPPLLASLLEVGEETGQLARMARRAGQICEDDVRLAIETASTVIEPILLAFVGGLTGVAVLVSALPMLSILRGL